MIFIKTVDIIKNKCGTFYTDHSACNMQNVVVKWSQNPCLAGSQHLILTSRISTAFYLARVLRSLAVIYPFLLSVEYSQLWWIKTFALPCYNSKHEHTKHHCIVLSVLILHINIINKHITRNQNNFCTFTATKQWWFWNLWCKGSHSHLLFLSASNPWAPNP